MRGRSAEKEIAATTWRVDWPASNRANCDCYRATAIVRPTTVANSAGCVFETAPVCRSVGQAGVRWRPAAAAEAVGVEPSNADGDRRQTGASSSAIQRLNGCTQLRASERAFKAGQSH